MTTTADVERMSPVVYVVAVGTFLMGTTEFVVAGLLPEIAADLGVSVAQAGLLITVFAVGMIIGAPVMAMLTLRLPQRSTLVLTLGVFAVGHVVVAMGSNFTLLLAARFLTAVATGAFWAVGNVVAARASGPTQSSRAIGLVGAGAMLANVVGVPLGAFVGQLLGWRGPFWALALLALACAVLIARTVPTEDTEHRSPSIRTEVAGLRSQRLWLVLAACATTTGGVLSAYSYVSPLLTERTGLASGSVPFVLAGFGLGALAGSVIGGRMGDRRPHTVTVIAPAASAALLAAICMSADMTWAAIAFVTLLGFFGLGANPVLISLAVRFADRATTLGSAMSVAAFNSGTALGSALAGRALGTSLGVTGPAAVGAVIAAATLVPVVSIALLQRRNTTQPTAPTFVPNRLIEKENISCAQP
jgi:multidrug resistance protein